MTRAGEKIREGSIWQRNVAEIISAIGEGWIDPLETWTYSSATVITTSASTANKYAVGDKIRLKQGGSYKYFVIAEVTSSTSLTVTGGSDYTVANAAITDNYYSHAASPMGYPNRFACTLTATGFSAAPTMTGLFRVIGRDCFLTVLTSANGTSNATSFTLTGVPIAAASASFSGGNYGHDNGVLQERIRASIAAAGTTITLLPDGAGLWTNVNAKGVNLNLQYPI